MFEKSIDEMSDAEIEEEAQLLRELHSCLEQLVQLLGEDDPMGARLAQLLEDWDEHLLRTEQQI